MANILILDDDEEMCEELSDILKREKHSVDVCNNGRVGFCSAEKGGYNIILLDLKMPGMNGYEVLNSIKNKGLPVKVLVLTGSTFSREVLPEELICENTEIKERLLNLADGVINKPFDVANLLRKIKELE